MPVECMCHVPVTVAQDKNDLLAATGGAGEALAGLAAQSAALRSPRGVLRGAKAHSPRGGRDS